MSMRQDSGKPVQMDDNIQRREFEEFKCRAEEKHERTNVRLKTLEESDKKMIDLIVSVREMAICIKNMGDELSRQGDKLEELDSRDGDMWRKATAYIVTAITGIVLGYVLKQFGIM